MDTNQTQAPTVDPITLAFLQARDPSATPDEIKVELIAMSQMGLLVVAPNAPAPVGLTPMTREQVVSANLKPELFDAGAKFYHLPSASPSSSSSTTKPSSDPVPWLLAGGGFALVALVAGAALRKIEQHEASQIDATFEGLPIATLAKAAAAALQTLATNPTNQVARADAIEALNRFAGATTDPARRDARGLARRLADGGTLRDDQLALGSLWATWGK